MAIDKNDLERMNALLDKGATIAQISKKYPDYEYWDIYWAVDGHSFHGLRLMISHRLQNMANANTKAERKEIHKDIKGIFDALYVRLKKNSKKLLEIDRTLHK